MGEEFQSHLKEQPEIVELFQVLEDSGLTKEFQEVESLVNYLEGMEKQFYKVLGELREVRGQLEQIQDKGIKATATRIVGKVEEKVQEISGKLTLVKENFIRSAGHAVGVFHEKGVDALRKAVSAMKIPSALSLLKEALHSGVESMDKHAAKIAAVSGELHKAVEHTKNVGRALFGRRIQEPEECSKDKGILAKTQMALLSCGSLFSGMEQATEKAMNRMGQFASLEKKSSVRAELKRMKGKKNIESCLRNPVQEKAR